MARSIVNASRERKASEGGWRGGGGAGLPAFASAAGDAGEDRPGGRTGLSDEEPRITALGPC